jgi:hypothetical protein
VRTTAKSMLALGTIFGALAIGSTASVRAQFPPQPPPPNFGYSPPPPPPPHSPPPPASAPRHVYHAAPPRSDFYPPSPELHTLNGCPSHYTVQDGLCKPIRRY